MTGPPGFLPIRIFRQALQDFYPLEFYDRPSMIYTHQNFTTGPPGFLPIGILRQALQDFYTSKFYARPSSISPVRTLWPSKISAHQNFTTGRPGFLPIRILRQALQDIYQSEFYDRPSRISTNQNVTTGPPSMRKLHDGCCKTPDGHVLFSFLISIKKSFCLSASTA